MSRVNLSKYIEENGSIFYAKLLKEEKEEFVKIKAVKVEKEKLIYERKERKD